jgi:hypothetical protein
LTEVDSDILYNTTGWTILKLKLNFPLMLEDLAVKCLLSHSVLAAQRADGSIKALHPIHASFRNLEE